MPGGLPDGVLSAIREVQIPLLAVMLLGGCGGKALRVLKARDVTVGLGPTALFPLRLRRPIAMAMCATELGLGIGLIVTAGRLGAGVPATIVRAGVSLLFLTAVGALVELRERRPDAGCGCFGELSVTTVGNRTIARSAVLPVAAIATVGQAPLRMPESGQLAAVWIVAVVAELLLLAALSPELGEAMARPGFSPPGAIRRVRHGPARLLRAVRDPADQRGPDAGRAGRQRALAPVRRPGHRARPGRHLARGLLALPGVPGGKPGPAGRPGLRGQPTVAPAPGPGGRAGRGHRRGAGGHPADPARPGPDPRPPAGPRHRAAAPGRRARPTLHLRPW